MSNKYGSSLIFAITVKLSELEIIQWPLKCVMGKRHFFGSPDTRWLLSQSLMSIYLHICKFSSLLVSVCPIVNNAQGDNTILHLFVNIPWTRSHGGRLEPRAVWTVKWMPGLVGE